MHRQAAQPTVTRSPIIDKYVKLSVSPDQLKKKRSALLPEIEKTLRAEVASYPYSDAVEIVSAFDGLIGIRVLMAIMDELKKDYEQKLASQYRLQTQGIAALLEKKFESFLDSIVPQIIAKKRKNVTQEEIDAIVLGITNDYWNQLRRAGLVEQNQLPDAEFCRLIRNYAFLVSASKVYKETDDMQMLELALSIHSLKAAARALSMPKEKMVESYQGLARCADQLVLSDDEKLKWGEVSVWLYGLYNHVYRAIDSKYIINGQVQKNDKGSYPTTDYQDEQFFRYKGITKFTMAVINQEMALKLARLLGLGLNKVASLSPHLAVVAPASVPLAAPLLIVTSLTGAREGWCISIPVSSEERAAKLAIVNKAVLSVESSSDKGTLSSELAKCAHASDDNKIIWFHSCLSRFALNANQNQSLGFLVNEMKSAFKAYRASGHFLSMKHADKSNVAEKLIEEEFDPKKRLDILFDLRIELIAENSVALLNVVNNLLLSSFTQIKGASSPLSLGACASATAKINRDDITCNVVSSDSAMHIEVKVYDADKKERLLQAIGAALRSQYLEDEKLPLELAQFLVGGDDDKINRLSTSIGKTDLTPAQNALLDFIANEVKAGFGAYRNSAYFFAMVHAEQSRVAEQQIEAAVGNPKKQLEILLELRCELKGDNSDHLKKKVDAVLIQVFNQLVMSLPAPEPTPAAAAARM